MAAAIKITGPRAHKAINGPSSCLVAISPKANSVAMTATAKAAFAARFGARARAAKYALNQ